jgi:hypothetical protein
VCALSRRNHRQSISCSVVASGVPSNNCVCVSLGQSIHCQSYVNITVSQSVSQCTPLLLLLSKHTSLQYSQSVSQSVYAIATVSICQYYSQPVSQSVSQCTPLLLLLGKHTSLLQSVGQSVSVRHCYSKHTSILQSASQSVSVRHCYCYSASIRHYYSQSVSQLVSQLVYISRQSVSVRQLLLRIRHYYSCGQSLSVDCRHTSILPQSVSVS